MYYLFLHILAFLIRLVNGPEIISIDSNYDPKETYLVVGPHRSLLDPVMIAIALYPRKVYFIGKKEIVDIPIIGRIFKSVGVIPVNREKPSRKSLKESVNHLREGHSVGIFPSGTRYKSELKSGYILIAQLAGVRILPCNYQGPIKISGLFSWNKANRVRLCIGAPISLGKSKKLTDEAIEAINKVVNEAFTKNDKVLNPNYIYDPSVWKKKGQVTGKNNKKCE